MRDFTFHVDTRIIFGKESVEKLSKELSNLNIKSILLCYGGGSIKRNGLYERVISEIEKSGATFTELSGIDPNPRLESVKEGISLARENKCDFILAVGGGSTIDCAKAIAAGFFYEADPWDLVSGKTRVKKALGLGVVLTLAATGSEMDTSAVISNLQTKEKRGFASRHLLPLFAIMDPQVTYSLPAKQTFAGIADIMSHTMENYFTRDEDTYMQDRMAEVILKTCIKYAKVLKEDPKNYEARANIMWASSWAINGFLDVGKQTSWTVHPIEHELSAHYDITHGIGLAIMTPSYLKYILSPKTASKLQDFAVNVFSVKKTENPMADAKKGIELLENFFNEVGIPTRLSQIGIGDELFEEMAEHVLKVSKIGESSYVKLNKEDVVKIYRLAL